MNRRAFEGVVFILIAGILLAIAGCGKAGPSKEFMSSRFSVAGSPEEIGTVADFMKNITGKKEWEKTSNGWILKTTVADEASKQTNKASFVFEQSGDHVMLSHAVVNDQDLPQEQVYNLAKWIISNPPSTNK